MHEADSAARSGLTAVFQGFMLSDTLDLQGLLPKIRQPKLGEPSAASSDFLIWFLLVG